MWVPMQLTVNGAGVDANDRHLKTPCQTTTERAAGTSIVTVEGVSFRYFPMTVVHPHAQHAADREEQ